MERSFDQSLRGHVGSERLVMDVIARASKRTWMRPRRQAPN